MDRNNSGFVLGDCDEHALGEIEMVARRITPAPVVFVLRVVGRAKIGGSYED